MEDKMKESIAKAINEHLPTAVGQELQIVLAEHKAQTTKIHQLEKRCEEIQQKYDDAQIKLEKHRKLDLREEELNTRELDLERRERDRALEVMKAEVRYAKENGETFKTFMLNMSRNTLFRKTVNGEKAMIVPGMPPDKDGYHGSPAYTNSVPYKHNEEVEEE